MDPNDKQLMDEFRKSQRELHDFVMNKALSSITMLQSVWMHSVLAHIPDDVLLEAYKRTAEEMAA